MTIPMEPEGSTSHAPRVTLGPGYIDLFGDPEAVKELAEVAKDLWGFISTSVMKLKHEIKDDETPDIPPDGAYR